jgi:hypothetical protein
MLGLYARRMATQSMISVLLGAIVLSGCSAKKPSTSKVRVGSAEYQFQTEDVLASLPGSSSAWVRVHSGPVTDPSSFILEYDEYDQDVVWPSGVP